MEWIISFMCRDAMLASRFRIVQIRIVQNETQALRLYAIPGLHRIGL